MASMHAAALRAADSLLRSVGGRQIVIRSPAPAIPSDDGEQLGLAAPQFQDTPLAPAVCRRVRPKIPANPASTPTQYELLLSATAVNAALSSQSYDSAATLFALAYGVLMDGILYEILSATTSEIAGAPYLYRLMLRAPLP
jgi:hypothetical protein